MNIFICQTPFQLFYANQIIRHFENRVENCETIIIHSNLNIYHQKWNSNTTFKNSRPGINLIRDFYALKKIINDIDNLIEEKGSEIEFFIPHIGGLLSNYIFYNKSQKLECVINFYYEGILYFYDFKEKFQLSHGKRIFTAFLLGFFYRYNKTILPYSTDVIDKIYTPYKEFTNGDVNKIIEIGLDRDTSQLSNQSENHFLILGGPVSFVEEFYHSCILDILDTDLPNFKIYYKGHASFQNQHGKFKNIFYKIIKEYSLDFIEIPVDIAIELTVESIKPYRIYSYYSSALLNINLMTNNKYDIVCYSEADNMDARLKTIFKRFGIKIIKLSR